MFCYFALMQLKNEPSTIAPDHSTLVNRIRQRAYNLVESGRLTPQDLQIIFELETQIQERLNKLQIEEKMTDKRPYLEEINQTVHDTTLPFTRSTHRSNPAEQTKAKRNSPNLTTAPHASKVAPRESATLRHSQIQHFPSRSRTTIQHNHQTQSTLHLLLSQVINKPAWPMPPPKRAPFNPAFAVTQAIPAPRRHSTT